MDRRTYWAIAIVVAASIAHSLWQYFTARRIAHEWLTRHGYRVLRLGWDWSLKMRFMPKMFRDDDRAVEFRAEVDDRRLGGRGVLWLRVWTDMLGLIDREPEINWERMPSESGPDAMPMDSRLADAQFDLLSRVAQGEFVFRATAQQGGAAFDEVVEHILALAQRGLVTHDPPMPSDRPGSQYGAVTNVAATDKGMRFYLERRRLAR